MFVKELLEEWNMQNWKTATTPLPAGTILKICDKDRMQRGRRETIPITYW